MLTYYIEAMQMERGILLQEVLWIMEPVQTPVVFRGEKIVQLFFDIPESDNLPAYFFPVS